MRIVPAGAKYESKIYVIDEEKLIFKIDCNCEDFKRRRIKKLGDFADVKYYAEPCKHLRPAVEALQRFGYTLKKPKEMEGPDKLTAEVKAEVIERSGGECEIYDCFEKATQFHRVIRGSNGGKYTVENVRHLCGEHHKQMHSNEFSGSKSK